MVGNTQGPLVELWTTIRCRLTIPATSIEDAGRRHHARLLAVLLIALISLIVLVFVPFSLFTIDLPIQKNPDLYISVGILASFVVAYRLNRIGRYEPAAILTVVSLSAGLFAMTVVGLLGGHPYYEPDDANLLITLVVPNPAKPEPKSLTRKRSQTERAFRAEKSLSSVQGFRGLGPILVASMLLPIPTTGAVVFLNIVGMIPLAVLFPQVTLATIAGGPLIFVLTVSTLIMLATGHRNRLASKRQASLAASEEKFRTLVENMGEGIGIVDEDERFVFANPAAERIFGVEPGDLVGRSLLEFVDDETATFLERQTDLRREGKTSRYDVSFFRDDRTQRYLSVTASPQVDEEGYFVRTLGIFNDVTERKRAEEARQESERILRSTLDGLSANVALLDDQGEILLVNKSWRDFAEQNDVPAEAVSEGTNYLDICDEASGDWSTEAESFAEGIRRVLAGDETFYRLQYPCHSPDEERWFIGRVTPFSGEGPRRVVVAHENITERKRAEEALRESEKRYRTVVEYQTDLLSRYRPDGTLTFVNEAYCRYFGKRRDELIGSNIKSVVPEGSWKELSDYLASFGPEKQVGRIEYQSVAAGGKIRWVQWIDRPILNERGEVLEFQSVGRDITKRKRAEEALKQKLTFEETVTSISARFVGDFDLNEAIDASLTEMGELSRADRVYVFLLRDDGDALDNTHEWCAEGIVGQIDNLQGLPSSTVPWWMAKLRRGEVIHIEDVSAMPEEAGAEREMLKEQDITSLLVLPLNVEGELAGFIGFDNVSEAKPWGTDDLSLLRMVGRILGNAIERKRAEDALRGSEARYRTLFETMAQGVVYQDMGGQIISANPAAERLLGLSVDQMMGHTSQDPRWHAIHENGSEFPGETHPAMIALRTGKEVENVIMGVFNSRDDDYRWINVHAVPQFKPEESEPFQVYTTFEDITERKRAEEALQERMKELSCLYAVSRDIQKDLSINELCQHTIEHLVPAMQFSEITVPVIELAGERYISENDAEGLSHALHAEIVVESEVYGHLWVYYTEDKPFLTPYEQDLVNSVAETLSIGIKRRQSEGALEQRAAQLALLNDVGSKIAAVLDLDLVMEQVVTLAQESFDYHHVGIFTMGKDSNRLVMRDRAGIYEGLYPTGHELALGQGIVGWAAQHGKTKLTNDVERDPHYVNLYPNVIGTRSELAVPIQSGGIAVGVLDIQSPELDAFDQDDVLVMETLADQISVALMNAQLYESLKAERASLAQRVAERTADLSRANAELARAARMKDEFLASMSHELRTPLNAILGKSEAMLEGVYGSLSEKQAKSLRTIGESGRHLLSLINDILDLSKIEAGKITLDIRPTPVQSVCQASLRMIKQLAHKKQLRVSSSFDSTVTTIDADARRLKQILVNLLNNAVKFTPEGGEVGLEVKGHADQNVVRFTVWDTGIGIALEDMERLFKPFVQLDSSLTRKYMGTGLGLSLVARMTELHGGSVTVESEVGQGSRFTVSLPWSKPDSTLKAEEEQMKAAPSKLPSIRRALVVEDSPTAAEQLARYLDELGAEAVVHPQGKGAVAEALETDPDVIILDIKLPDQPGWEVLAQLKATSGARDIPVLVISVVDDRSRGVALGAAGYLVKPITRRQMCRALNCVLTQDKADARALVVASDQDRVDSAPSILLAEDNETNIETIMDYLLDKGYRVTVARNGREVLDRMEEVLPDLILMDIQMPDMDGLEAIRRIRDNDNPAFATIPIITLTALAMPGDRERCLKAGADEYLSKPVSMKGLSEMIEARLRGSRDEEP